MNFMNTIAWRKKLNTVYYMLLKSTSSVCQTHSFLDLKRKMGNWKRLHIEKENKATWSGDNGDPFARINDAEIWVNHFSLPLSIFKFLFLKQFWLSLFKKSLNFLSSESQNRNWLGWWIGWIWLMNFPVLPLKSEEEWSGMWSTCFLTSWNKQR